MKALRKQSKMILGYFIMFQDCIAFLSGKIAGEYFPSFTALTGPIHEHRLQLANDPFCPAFCPHSGQPGAYEKPEIRI